MSDTRNDLAQERYQDLIEYFGDEKVAKAILEDRKEFKAWFERLRWNVKRADELARELNQIIKGTTKNDSSELDKNSKKLEKNFGESAYIDRGAIKYYPGAGGYMYASKGEIDKLPSVTIENDLAVDCIDRNDIKYYSWDGTYRLNSMYASKKQIDDLPSVIPIRFVDTNKIQGPTTKNDLRVDCISRADVLQILLDYDYANENALVLKDIKELPSITPQPCEDAISRQALLNATVNKNSIWNKTTDSKGENLETIISKLPSVTLQPRKGHWVDCKCDKCGYVVQPWNTTSFCPNCGSDNREVKE